MSRNYTAVETESQFPNSALSFSVASPPPLCHAALNMNHYGMGTSRHLSAHPQAAQEPREEQRTAKAEDPREPLTSVFTGHLLCLHRSLPVGFSGAQDKGGALGYTQLHSKASPGYIRHTVLVPRTERNSQCEEQTPAVDRSK